MSEAPQNTFSNDGSFLEQFKNLQPEGGKKAKRGETEAGGAEGNAAFDWNSLTPEQQQYYQAYYAQMYQGNYQYGVDPYSPFGQNYQPYQAYREGEPSNTIWLGNMPSDTTEKDLGLLFNRFGPVHEIKALPQKNCAFVKYVRVSDAIEAYNHMQSNGCIVRGIELRVGWGKTDAGGESLPATRNLWIGNLPDTVTETELKKHFADFGAIEKIRILPHKNCGFIYYVTLEAAINARNAMQGFRLGHSVLKINYGKQEASADDAGPKLMPIGAQPIVIERDPPPPRATRPNDEETAQLIEKTVGFVLKNGSRFEDMIKLKRAGDPKFFFLSPGTPENAYYLWSLWLGRNPDAAHMVGETPKPDNPETRAPIHQVALTPDEVSKLSQLLKVLVPTKESIKETKNWIMSKPSKAEVIAGMLLTYVESAATFETKLNAVYLINDVLHHAARQRAKPGDHDEFCDAISKRVVPIFKSACSDQIAENTEKCLKVLRIWGSKDIFPTTQVQQWEQSVTGSQAPPQPPPPSLPPASLPLQQPPPPVYRESLHTMTQTGHRAAPPPPPLADRDRSRDTEREAERRGRPREEGEVEDGEIRDRSPRRDRARRDDYREERDHRERRR